MKNDEAADLSTSSIGPAARGASAGVSHRWASGVFTLLVLVASVLGTYKWQHNKYAAEVKLAADTNSKLTVANKNLSSASALVTDLTKQVNTLTAQNKQLEGELKYSSNNIVPQQPSQADLNLVVNGSEYVNPDGTVTQGGKWFGVNLTLTNNTSGDIKVSNNKFQLKDAQNNYYTEETTINASTLPAGWVSLANPTIAPGQSVRGTITFVMPSTTTKSFTFINDTKTYPVTSAN